MVTESQWRRAIIRETSVLSDVIRNLDKSKLQISLVVSDDDVLIGTITDGNVRRGLLKGLSLDSPIDSIINHRAMVVPQNMSRELVMQMMRINRILQIPIIDERSRVVGLHLWNELSSPPARSNLMVIMAGGFGTRLRPYTENCPKPMLEVNGKPILQHIIENAKVEGFDKFVVATYYLGHLIEDYFGDGSKFHVNIEYLHEKSPLGTSGALSLLNFRPSSPFIVTNGDIISDISYGNILEFHRQQTALATMAVRQHEIQNPFGVVQVDGLKIVGFEEKPVIRSNINAGVYVLNPEVLDYVKPDIYCDMPSLFTTLRKNGKPIMAYPIHEDWMDIGRYKDLIHANNKLKNPDR